MSYASFLLGIGCAAAIVGCGMIRIVEPLEPAPWVQAGTPRPTSDTESLLLYYRHIRNLTGPDASREHERAWQAYAQAPTDFNRVRLAMVLSLPGTAFYDNARALGLLDTVAKRDGGRLQGLAAALGAQLQEQQRLAANAQELQQKLDALKSLERSMIEKSR
ncbi:MAG TPA: hypothetical protein VLC73_07490 [Burkholderiales bacterium]|nr:hypothetical protein [Burkholderiales bacterium]